MTQKDWIYSAIFMVILLSLVDLLGWWIGDLRIFLAGYITGQIAVYLIKLFVYKVL